MLGALVGFLIYLILPWSTGLRTWRKELGLIICWWLSGRRAVERRLSLTGLTQDCLWCEADFHDVLFLWHCCWLVDPNRKPRLCLGLAMLTDTRTLTHYNHLFFSSKCRRTDYLFIFGNVHFLLLKHRKADDLLSRIKSIDWISVWNFCSSIRSDNVCKLKQVQCFFFYFTSFFADMFYWLGVHKINFSLCPRGRYIRLIIGIKCKCTRNGVHMA